MLEPRCLVCGSPLAKGAPFEKDVRQSEVCSDECLEIYMFNEDDREQLLPGAEGKDGTG